MAIEEWTHECLFEWHIEDMKPSEDGGTITIWRGICAGRYGGTCNKQTTREERSSEPYEE